MLIIHRLWPKNSVIGGKAGKRSPSSGRKWDMMQRGAVNGALLPKSSSAAAFQSQWHYLFRPKTENRYCFKELQNWQWNVLSNHPGASKCKTVFGCAFTVCVEGCSQQGSWKPGLPASQIRAGHTGVNTRGQDRFLRFNVQTTQQLR